MKEHPLNPATELLNDEMLHRELTKVQAAKDMNIPPSRLTDIMAGRKRISYDTALRLQKYLGIEAALFLRLQMRHELEIAELEKKAEIKKIKRHKLSKQAAPQSA